jgi:hypothetical protein
LNRANYNDSENKIYYLISDQKGKIRIFDMNPIIQKFKFEKVNKSHISSKFNLMKKDDINVEAIISYYLQK